VANLPYRLSSWALDDPENVRLWSNVDGRLLAWAVLQSPWWTIDYAIHPDAEREIHPQILAWADDHARAILDTPYGRPCWYAMAFADQTERRRELEAAGLACQSDAGEDAWSKVLMERPADLPVKEYRIPEGFTVRPLAGEAEVEAYVRLHQETFESKNMTVEWRKRTLQHHDHVPDLDLVVVVPDGRLAAFCICWLDKHNSEPVGQVEPLGCHTDFRRYALGHVALAEGLRRLQAHGAKKIFVETDNYRNTAFRLYESLGFRVVRNVIVDRKDS